MKTKKLIKHHFNHPINKIFLLSVISVMVVLVISFITVSYTQRTQSRAENLQIIGGRDVKKGEYPSVVMVNNGCTGVSVDPQWVLTAAHCLHRGEPVYVYYGTIYPLPLISRRYDVLTTVIHPDFNYYEKINDLALLLLNTEFENIPRPVLPQMNFDEAIYVKDNQMEVVGWGWREYNKPAIILQTINLPVYSSSNDNNFLAFKVGYEGKKAMFFNVGNGDSGGPVFYRKNGVLILAGIVSEGDTNEYLMVKEPFTVTKIIHYTDWINKTIEYTPKPSPKPTEVLNKSLINPKQLFQVCDQYKTEKECIDKGLRQGCAFHKRCYVCVPVPILFSLIPFSSDYCNWVYEQIRIERGGVNNTNNYPEISVVPE